MNHIPDQEISDNIQETRNIFYDLEPSFQLQQLLKVVELLKDNLDSFRPLKEKEHLWEALQEKIRAEWTYHSNAIEGSTLTLGETIFFLQYGLTIEGKPFKDFLDAKNHIEAIELLYEFLKEDRPINETFIKEVNALLLSGVSYTKAIDQFGNLSKKPATPGQYKKLPNTVLTADGLIHEYVHPLQVSSEIQYLCDWINQNINKINPVIVGAIAHYNFVRIHPFDDGNGRGARILLNLILLKNKYPPTIIKLEQRRKYIECLDKAHKGNISLFIEFIAESCIKTQEMMIDTLDKKK